jgi:hypothetical protein
MKINPSGSMTRRNLFEGQDIDPTVFGPCMLRWNPRERASGACISAAIPSEVGIDFQRNICERGKNLTAKFNGNPDCPKVAPPPPTCVAQNIRQVNWLLVANHPSSNWHSDCLMCLRTELQSVQILVSLA